MKVAVMGAGAVGCYFGARLAQAGHDVVLIGRPALATAIAQDGLQLESNGGSERISIDASTDAAAAAGAGLVLFCVKSGDTHEAAQQLAPYLDEDACVLSLQNGVENAERLRALLRAQVVATVVYVAVEMVGAARVRHHGRGDLVVGTDEPAARAKAVLEAAHIPVRTSHNVPGELWLKLIVNAALNPLSAITRLSYGALWKGVGVEAVLRSVVAECVSVARAAGIELPADPWQAVVQIAAAMPAQLSSTAQDLERGRPTEIDYLNGFVVRTAERVGALAPLNRMLEVCVHLLETQAPETTKGPAE